MSTKTHHVTPTGDDGASGNESTPLRTIQAAADRARPGDTILVHAGVYRERINPPRGGDGEDSRIIYQAAPGERVEIAGSELARGWISIGDGVWELRLPSSYFGDFNPYAQPISGDWFDPKGREHHPGAVYLDGRRFDEAAESDQLLEAVHAGLWHSEVTDTETVIRATFGTLDPNEALVEINVRQTVFYPDRPGMNYLAVRGFVLRDAATPWAPPTAEQIGLLGTHWSKGWLIENNIVLNSACSGISLGKHGDRFDNTSEDTAEGYVATIERAFNAGWAFNTIGSHVVRGNVIAHCEQAGIVGSLGAIGSTIENNTIHDVHVRQLFGGAEMAGIKLHAAIDTTIRRNHIYRCCRGLWLDWMAQGTRVSSNLFHDNVLDEDLFLEVNHGPFVVDNNILLSPVSLRDMSEGGAYAHNLFGGRIVHSPEPRRATPYHPAHSTSIADIVTIAGGDNRFFNNVFVGRGRSAAPVERVARHGVQWKEGYGLHVYDDAEYPIRAAGNVYFAGAVPPAVEHDPLALDDHDPEIELVEQNRRVRLRLRPSPDMRAAATTPVTTELLGSTKVSRLPFETPEGDALRIDTDYTAASRDADKPGPGPIENPADAAIGVPADYAACVEPGD